MRYSIFLPTIHEGRFIPIGALRGRHVTELASAAEELGFDGVWVGEFLETQEDVSSQYDQPPNYLAPLGLMGYLVAKTQRLSITTGVLVLPYHDPLILARELASLDVLSGGRIRAGVGLGGSKSHYERTRKLQVSTNRAELMEETILAMRELWSKKSASFEGKYWAFDSVESYPKPVGGTVPIMIAGGVPAVADRVGRLGDGWIDTYMPPAALADNLQLIAEAKSKAQRGSHDLKILRSFYCALGDSDEDAERLRREATPGGRPAGKPNSAEREFLLVGSPDTVRNQLARFVGLGVNEINIAFFHRTPGDAIRQAERFATEVVPGLEDVHQ